MSKKSVGFYHGALADSYEKQANAQGFTQGLFRGREVNSNEWVYGYYIQLYGVGSIVKEVDNQGNLLLGVYSLFVDDAVDTSDLVVDYTVDTNTVGPWTGKTDVNGVRIFEDDLLICVDFDDAFRPPYTTWDGDLIIEHDECQPDDCQSEKPMRVVWDSERAAFVAVAPGLQPETLDGVDWVVVGNVYDNPELLNGNLE